VNGEEVVEVLSQEASFEVVAFLFLHREWAVHRRGRYSWVRTPGGWQIRSVEVLEEKVRPNRMWLAFK
jgi:hypothetical protein